MHAYLHCLSHSPLVGYVDPAQEVLDEVNGVIASARERIAAFSPELVVLFAPDHYNGFFYDVMPPFCLGVGATAIGDFGSAAGELPVPVELAEACAHAVMKSGIDLAVSYCMQATVRPVFMWWILAGAVLQSGQLITIELPEWLLAMAYMAIGWRIGLGFDKQILLRALRPLPQILLSIFALLAICAGMAWGLTRFMHIDFMTAYLATSPGGLDTVAVIAAGSNADMALIMAMQTLRLFSILLTGPAIARFISTYAPKRSA